MRVSFFMLAVLGPLWAAPAVAPPALAAQWPGEVSGRVVDALSGQGVAAARVGSTTSPHHAVTDGQGRFHLRGLEPGEHHFRVEHPAYAPADVSATVRNGRTRLLTVTLQPAVVAIPGLRVTVAPAVGGGYRLVVQDVVAPTGTAGDLLRSVPGVVVTRRGGGSAQTISIRGSAPDDVLVLVDGVPLNDVLTGAADLSALAASAVEEVTVLPGARSARYGPGAQAGVVLITTAAATSGPDGPDGRGRADGPRGRVGAGSLGRGEAGLEWTGAAAGVRWEVEGAAERTEGSFPFRRPVEAGGGEALRENADVTRRALRGGARGELGGGELRGRASWESVDRGLPGRGYAPTPAARQEEERLRVSGDWSRERGAARTRIDAWLARNAARFHDPAPPTGLPWDETTRMSAGGAGISWTAAPASSLLGEVGAGAELTHQRVRSPSLSRALVPRTDAGAWALASLRPPWDGPSLEVVGTLRLDRAGLDGSTHVSHEASVAAGAGAFTVHAAHRSAFSPPSLADQLFREGVGVRANPDLRGERIPSEVELGVSFLAGSGEGVSLAAAVTAYRGDVRDMIEWAPDHRFVWSPANVDVERRGVDVSGRLGVPAAGGRVEVEGAWSRARVTYARPELAGIQLRYRPRHTAHLAAAWRGERVRAGVEAHRTGARHPVPAPSNVLPGFWTADLSAAVDVLVDRWELRPTLRVSRLLGARDSMIFGFPEPGRTLTVGLEVRPAPGSR